MSSLPDHLQNCYVRHISIRKKCFISLLKKSTAGMLSTIFGDVSNFLIEMKKEIVSIKSQMSTLQKSFMKTMRIWFLSRPICRSLHYEHK